MISLCATLEKVPQVRSLLNDAESLLLQVLAENSHELPETVSLIGRSIADDPPISVTDGGVIREGFSGELDELRGLSANAKKTIAGFEKAELPRIVRRVSLLLAERPLVLCHSCRRRLRAHGRRLHASLYPEAGASH